VQPERNEPARFDLQAVDALVERRLHERVREKTPRQVPVQARAQVDQRRAAVVDVGVGPAGIAIYIVLPAFTARQPRMNGAHATLSCRCKIPISLGQIARYRLPGSAARQTCRIRAPGAHRLLP
jgi:hypothetical protein